MSGLTFAPSAVMTPTTSFGDFLEEHIIKSKPDEMPEITEKRSMWRRSLAKTFRGSLSSPVVALSSSLSNFSSNSLNPEHHRLQMPWMRRFHDDAPVLRFFGRRREDVCLWTRRTVRLALTEHWCPDEMVTNAVSLTNGRARQWANIYRQQHPENGYDAFWEFIRSIVREFSPQMVSSSVRDRWFTDQQRLDQDPLDFMTKMNAVGKLISPPQPEYQRQYIRHIVDRMLPEVQDMFICNFDRLQQDILCELEFDIYGDPCLKP